MISKASASPQFRAALNQLPPPAQQQAARLAEVVDDITRDGKVTTDELLSKLGPAISELRHGGYAKELEAVLGVLLKGSDIEDRRLLGQMSAAFSLGAPSAPMAFTVNAEKPSELRAFADANLHHLDAIVFRREPSPRVEVEVAAGSTMSAAAADARKLAAATGLPVLGTSPAPGVAASKSFWAEKLGAAPREVDAHDPAALRAFLAAYAPGLSSARLDDRFAPPVIEAELSAGGVLGKAIADVGALSMATGLPVVAEASAGSIRAEDGAVSVVSNRPLGPD